MSKTAYFDIKGIKEIEKALEELAGESKTGKVMNKSLNVATEKVASNLKDDITYFKDKGHMVDEVVVSKARRTRTRRTTNIGWNGPMHRYRIVHLNEFGYMKSGIRYNPRGMGAIEKSINRSNPEFLEIVTEEMKKGLDKLS